VDWSGQKGWRVDLVQDWCDPLHQARPLRGVCRESGIAFQAYSLLNAPGWRRKHGRNMVLTHPTIAAVAAELETSAARSAHAHQPFPWVVGKLGPTVFFDRGGLRRVVMAWALAREISVLPRSTNAAHLAENLALLPNGASEPEPLVLPEDALRRIDELDGTEGDPYG